MTAPKPTVVLKPPQWEVFNSKARFRVLVAGRRFGKTFLSLVELCRAAWAPGRLAWYIAPTYKQAKRIAWKPLKNMTRPYWATTPNETDLRIDLVTGGTICLRGAENYNSLRGDGLDFLILDEYASVMKETWPEVLRPSLADKGGGALFIGTPKGCNHFYDLYESAAGQAGWERFQFTTAEGGNVTPEELESATHEVDEKTYRQEFEASFENQGAGLVYDAFDRTENVRSREFNPLLPLFWAIDFNVDPLCSVIGQRDGNNVYVIDEIVLKDSNTAALGDAFLSRISRWPMLVSGPQILVYGDSSGNSRHTSAPRTDWEIIKEFFRSQSYRVNYRVRPSNPLVRDRVNCVNAVLHSQAGERRLRIDPKCKQLIQDFERVRWKMGTSSLLSSECAESSESSRASCNEREHSLRLHAAGSEVRRRLRTSVSERPAKPDNGDIGSRTSRIRLRRRRSLGCRTEGPANTR